MPRHSAGPPASKHQIVRCRPDGDAVCWKACFTRGRLTSSPGHPGPRLARLCAAPYGGLVLPHGSGEHSATRCDARCCSSRRPAPLAVPMGCLARSSSRSKATAQLHVRSGRNLQVPGLSSDPLHYFSPYPSHGAIPRPATTSLHPASRRVPCAVRDVPSVPCRRRLAFPGCHVPLMSSGGVGPPNAVLRSGRLSEDILGT